VATIKVREALRRCSVLLLDIEPQFVRYEERWMVDALNDAQAAIHKYIPSACTRIDAIKLKPGSLQSIESIAAADCKPGDGSTPAVPIVGTLLNDVLCNMGAAGTTPGRAIRPVPDGRESLDSIDPNWRTVASTEVRSYVFDPRSPRHFEVNPAVHASTAVWVRASVVAQPLPVANTGTPGSDIYGAYGGSTTLISVADEHIDDLVYYVCARMLMMNSQFTGANGMTSAAFVGLFTASINAKATLILGYNPNLKTLPFAPEPIGRAA
jgi:hypothetical protein